MQQLMIITSYFPPEIGAASNRIYHLAEGLKSEYKVTVITPLPNYPTGKIFDSYKRKRKATSHENGIEIHRLWIYPSISKNKFIRLFAMLSYSFSLIWFFIWHKIPSKVIVQSPPLLVSFTCMFFLRSKKRKLILNVSDLWPSAGFELGALKKNFSYWFLQKLEHFNYKNAQLILGQSEEILSHIKTITTKPDFFLYRNYPDINPIAIPEKPNSKNLKMVYAGLLGVAQGIFKLCQSLNLNNIEFHIYGSGAEEEKIKDFIRSQKTLSIYFHGRLDRDVLHKTLINYDIAIIPLLKRIYGSVPSKIFEYAKLGLPLLYFGGGEGEDIIQKFKLGWVASQGDYRALNQVIQQFDAGQFTKEKKEVIQSKAYEAFDFKKQLNELKAVL